MNDVFADARRFGLLADTHDEFVEWPPFRAAIAGALGTVDAILHCGDLTSAAALADFAAMAPIVAVRSAADPPPAPPQLLDGPVVFQAGGYRLGLVNTMEVPAPGHAQGAVEVVFGDSVDVVVFGGTHAPVNETIDGILFVNPGSPTLSESVTIGVLDLDADGPRATIIPITRPT